MQYWIFFWGGVGGDGFSNLLEQADNIQPSDGVLKWRTSLTTSGKIRFEQPNWVEDLNLFRNHYEGFDPEDVIFNPVYLDFIKNKINTVIPAHPWKYFDILDSLSYKDTLTTDQHRIFLYSTDIERVIEDFIDKENPDDDFKRRLSRSYRKNDMMGPKVYPPKRLYNTFIDIDRSWKDWDYLDTILTSIGINLSKSAYATYLRVAKRP
jgi:hypothetical protein